MKAQDKQKLLAGSITIGSLLVLYFLMNRWLIPQQDLIAKHYDEIDWMRFRPKRITFDKPNEAKPENKPAEEPSVKASTVKRMNLEDLMSEVDLDNLDLETSTPDLPGQTSSNHAASNVRLQLQETLDSEGLNLTLGEDTPFLPMNRRNGNTPAGSGNIELVAGTGAAAGVGLGSMGDDVGADLQGPRAYGKKGGTVGVEMKSIEDFGEGYDDFSEIYKPLVEWMKLHPAVLPDVVKRFMKYHPGDLTSWVHFTIQERTFEMFLLCIESTYEVRIALVENQQVTYLIDQGFRKKTNYLRIGNVDRLENQEILKFGTKLRPASDQTAVEFYRIFLSWWEEVKHEVEK